MKVFPQGQLWHAKGACYLCPRNGPILDTGMQIEGEGVLAICMRCISEMAAERGFDTLEASEKNRAKIKEQRALIVDLMDQISTLERAYAEVVRMHDWALERGMVRPEEVPA